MIRMFVPVLLFFPLYKGSLWFFFFFFFLLDRFLESLLWLLGNNSCNVINSWVDKSLVG